MRKKHFRSKNSAKREKNVKSLQKIKPNVRKKKKQTETVYKIEFLNKKVNFIY